MHSNSRFNYLRGLVEREHFGIFRQMIAQALENGYIGFSTLRDTAENVEQLLDGHSLDQFQDARVDVSLQTFRRLAEEEEEAYDGIGVEFHPSKIQLTHRRFF